MTECERLAATEPSPMLMLITGTASDRKFRLFACGCCRMVWHIVPDSRNLSAVEVAERFADGASDSDQLASANEASYGVYANVGSPQPGFPDPTTGLSRSGWEAAQAATLTAMKYASPDDSNFGARIVAYQAVEALAYATLSDHPPGVIAEYAKRASELAAKADQSDLARDIFGNPFRPATFSPEWRTSTAVALAHQMYESRDFSAMPILADALQDAGCDNDDILNHCRDANGVHVRGCWVVDAVLGKS